MTEPTEAQLHARILAGDQVAMAIWHNRVAPRVRGLLRAKGVPDNDSEEIFDDVFVSTVRHAARIGPQGSGLTTYILGAAWKRVAEYYEKTKRAVETVPIREEEDDVQEASSPTYGDPVAWAAIARAVPAVQQPSPVVERLRKCLDEARPGVRRLAELWMENATEDEVARALGIAATSVRKYVQRMKLALQQCMEKGEESRDGH
jgi:DNA-directed RNA polymerase specialized sigma24 family protein